MRKRLITAGIIFWMAVLISSVGLLLISLKGGFQFNMDSKLLKEESIRLKEYEKIAIESDSLGIELRESATDEIEVEQYGGSRTEEEELFRISEQGKTIQIKQKNRLRLVSLNFNLNEKLIVHIPKAYLGDLQLENSSGGVEIEDSFAFKDLDIKNSSGGIRIKSPISAENASINTISGGIRAEGNVTVAQLTKIKSSSGGIRFSKNLKTDTLTAKCTSGGIRLTEVEAEDFDIKCSSGSIKVEAIAGGGSINSTSGGITMGIANMTDDISVKSSSGGMKLTVASGLEFQFTGRCTSGSIKSNFPLDTGSNNHKAEAIVGNNPTVTLSAVSTSGGIKIKQD